MPRPPIDWAHCRSFLAVMQEGSLSRAAHTLSLTQPTVGRHIAGLEDSLGTKLFTRSHTGLLPTVSAHELLPHAEAMASASEALSRTASGEAQGTRGVVRLTASEFVGVEVLPPMLASFREKNPHIDIELAVSNRQQDLLRREADLAVRMVRPQQAALIAKRIGTIPIGLYAHRSYVERRGTPEDVNALLQHTLIGFDRDLTTVADSPAGFPITREIFAFRCDNDLAQLAALRAGFGIGGCHVALAARDPELVPVLAGTVFFDLEMWLAMHEDLKANQRVRLLFDHLAATLSAYVKSGNPGPGGQAESGSETARNGAAKPASGRQNKGRSKG
jgi:DNA-binding transcriptional LysR family regulator